MAVPNSINDFLGIDKPTLPYRSLTSPTDDSPHFVQGSKNFHGTIGGWLEKRQGFSAALESAVSTIPGTVVRLYGWKRWSGSTVNADVFFVMACAVTATSSTVFKYAIAKDTSFSAIWTDTETGNPFDFTVSNNFVFFGNASTRINMRKWDGTDCTLWGLDAPPAAPSFDLVTGTLPAGFSFDTTTGLLSGTPVNSENTSLTVTATDSSGATSTQTINLTIDPAGLAWTTSAGSLPPSVSGTAYGYTLQAQSGSPAYTFSVFSGTLPAGLSLASSGAITGTPSATGNFAFAVKVIDSVGATLVRSFSLFVGSNLIAITPTTLPNAAIGSFYSVTMVASGGTSPYVYGFVGGNVPAGIAIDSSTGVVSGTPTSAGMYNLVLKVTDAASNATEFLLPLTVQAVDLTIITTSLPNAQQGVSYSQTVMVSGGTSPYSFTYTAGSITAYTGYVWGYTYTSKYGHESAMSALSKNSGLFTDQNVDVDVIASSDPQVNGINLYRSTDGGDQDPVAMRLDTSLANITASYEDSTQDIFLGSLTGPALYLNDPPQPIKGLVWSNGRIWGFKDSTTWFTGNEEITNGIPAECMSDAKNGNFYQWPSEVGGLAVTANGVDIGLSEEFWQISGDNLDTFRKNRLLEGGGCLFPTNITTIGDTVYWIDTGKQVWSSDRGEIGQSIRPDLENIDPAQSFLTYHKFQDRNWLILLDAKNSHIIPYDFDLEAWQAPWTCAASAIASMQTSFTSVGMVSSFAGNVRMYGGGYDDNGVLFDDEVRTGLNSIVPGSRTSARNPEEIRQPSMIDIETDVTPIVQDGVIVSYQANVPDHVRALGDDDPKMVPLDGWADAGEPQPLQFGSNQDQHQYLIAKRFNLGSAAITSCRRCAMSFAWDAAPTGWKLYSFDLGKAR